jgi:hypothetical protein
MDIIRTEIRSQAGGLKTAKLYSFLDLSYLVSAPLTPCTQRFPTHGVNKTKKSARHQCITPLHPHLFDYSFRLTQSNKGFIMRRWRNPCFDVGQREGNLESSSAIAPPQACVFECLPNIVVVITCSHTSWNRRERDAVVAGALKAQADLHRRFACVQTVIDTQPASCDDILPAQASFFDVPPRNLVPPHSKVFLVSSSDDASFTLRPPLTLPSSSIMYINTILDSTFDLRPHKGRIHDIITTAYEQSTSLSNSLVLKASLATNVVQVGGVRCEV